MFEDEVDGYSKRATRQFEMCKRWARCNGLMKHQSLSGEMRGEKVRVIGELADSSAHERRFGTNDWLGGKNDSTKLWSVKTKEERGKRHVWTIT